MIARRGMLILSSGLTIALMVGMFAACAIETQSEQDDLEGEIESERGLVPSFAGDTPPVEQVVGDQGAVEGDDLHPLAGCSHVQWCSAPNGEGTVCRQSGCSKAQAIAECKSEAPRVCRSICPGRIYFLDGSSQNLCQTPCPGSLDLCPIPVAAP